MTRCKKCTSHRFLLCNEFMERVNSLNTRLCAVVLVFTPRARSQRVPGLCPTAAILFPLCVYYLVHGDRSRAVGNNHTILISILLDPLNPRVCGVLRWHEPAQRVCLKQRRHVSDRHLENIARLHDEMTRANPRRRCELSVY